LLVEGLSDTWGCKLLSLCEVVEGPFFAAEDDDRDRFHQSKGFSHECLFLPLSSGAMIFANVLCYELRDEQALPLRDELMMRRIQHGSIETGDVASAKAIGRTYLGTAAACKIHLEVSGL
jgi:hypothetical protein